MGLALLARYRSAKKDPDPDNTASFLAAEASVSGLSSREIEVMRLLVVGRSNRQVAGALFIRRCTAVKGVGAILAKVNFSSHAEAVVYALHDAPV
jgi:DNA-binding NarL/FixJ family response regulator